MPDTNYAAAMAGLLKDFAELLHRRDELTVKLVEILAAVRAMSGVPGNNAPSQPDIGVMEQRIWQPRPSLSYAVEALLKNSMESWTPVQIREALLRRGYDLGKYSFPMAMIHTALKGLVSRGLVFREVLADESKLYSWAGARAAEGQSK